MEREIAAPWQKHLQEFDGGVLYVSPWPNFSP